MPFGIIGFIDIEFDKDMRFDVYRLENGCRRWSDDGQSVLDRGVGGGVRTGIGRREIEEGIYLHVHDVRTRSNRK